MKKIVDAQKTGAKVNGQDVYRVGRKYYRNPVNTNRLEPLEPEKTTTSKRDDDYDYDYNMKKPEPPQPMAAGGGVGVDGLLGGLVVSALMITFMLVSALLILLYSVVKAWPDLVMQLVDAFAKGAADLSVIIAAAAMVFLVVYFIVSVCLVISRKEMRSRNFLIVCTAVPTVLYSFFPLLVGNFSIVMILVNALGGLSLAALPTFLLRFVEHLATKRLRGDPEWFITKVSRLVGRGFPGHETGMMIFGVLAVFAGMFFNGVSKLADAEAVSGVPGPTAVILFGALILLMGVFARKPR